MKDYNTTNFVTGMRFYAVFLVFFSHIHSLGIYESFPSLEVLYNIGKYGVDIFFVISGFTICYQLQRVEIKKFLYYRICRISIVYWPFVLLITFISCYFNFNFTKWATLADDINYIVNLLGHMVYWGAFDIRFSNSIVGVEWSLNIEIFYYIMFAIFIGIGFRMKLTTLLIFSLLSLIFSLLFSIFRHVINISDYYYMWSPVKYSYMFFLGGLSCCLRDRLFSNPNIDNVMLSNVAITISAILVFFCIFFKVYLISSFITSFIFALISFILLVFVCAESKLSYVFTNRIAVFLGGISFSFYLIHYPVINVVSYLDYSVTMLLLFSLSSSVFLSYIWYSVFERISYNKLKSFYG